MPYCDGFVLPLKRENVEAYRAMAETAAAVWLEHGALEYREWLGDDVQAGKVTSFPQAVKLEDGELVVFAWVTYASREARDACVAKVMDDPRLQDMPKDVFDGKRMFWGGFAPLVARP